MRNYITDNTVEKTFRAESTIEEADVFKEQKQYTYKDDSQYVFMDLTTFEEIHLNEGSAHGIDFDRLFKSCNRVHVAKLLHALVFISGKAQSVFSLTSLLMFMLTLVLSHSRVAHSITFAHMLKACSELSAMLVNCSMICRKLANAQKVFDNMVVRDVVSWNSIIVAYEQNDDPDKALALFYDMQLTCSFILTTCAF
ncbi:hypothetical protein F3Y22_tig00110263pilonHSYRG00012 [Hibiscus syriacus]|uniref:Translation elongation factor P/YeiP central domain-containing protein n=1 Tax=Hibiscus syriacus TaxID=106335 RepID=A0A6A3B5T2_HIBSY|nr:hypothetical protein F3Y22_tig00110263pilonHSYRG00012 [Hibiscus syriacus]